MKTQSSVSLLITSGNGPAECEQAVAHVLKFMTHEANGKGLEINCIVEASKHGAKSAVVVIHGQAASAFSQQWLGTIQWRAPSKLRPQHKRANWFVGVFALADNKPTSMRKISATDVSFESFRAGGPGGQHQNTTDSAIRAVHRPTGLTAIARDERSQHRNKSLALERLQELAAAQFAYEAEWLKHKTNSLHKQLERGNPVRRFKGGGFVEHC